MGPGLGSIAAVTVSGLEAYDTTLLSTHMVQHMVLTMVAPIFLALGAMTVRDHVYEAIKDLDPRAVDTGRNQRVAGGSRAIIGLEHCDDAAVITSGRPH